MLLDGGVTVAGAEVVITELMLLALGVDEGVSDGVELAELALPLGLALLLVTVPLQSSLEIPNWPDHWNWPVTSSMMRRP